MMAAARRGLWPSLGLTLSGLDFQTPLSPGLARDQGCLMHGLSLTPGSTSTSCVLRFLSSVLLFLDSHTAPPSLPATQLWSLHDPLQGRCLIFHKSSCGDPNQTSPSIRMDVCFSGQLWVLWAPSPSGWVQHEGGGSAPQQGPATRVLSCPSQVLG